MSNQINQSGRFNYFGVEINATNLNETEQFLLNYDYDSPNYVLFPDSSVVASAQDDQELKAILNNSLLTLPDGLPSALYARKQGFKEVSTVSGYLLCHALLKSSLSHYFLGASDTVLQKIKENISQEFPAAKLLGFQALPFYQIGDLREKQVLRPEIEQINRLKPDLIWLGIGSPKQDFIVHHHAHLLNHGLMLGVGGVFDYLAGTQKKSPEWMKKAGLRWLWRLAKEPRRLGPKYLSVIRFYFSQLGKRKM